MHEYRGITLYATMSMLLLSVVLFHLNNDAFIIPTTLAYGDKGNNDDNDINNNDDNNHSLINDISDQIDNSNIGADKKHIQQLLELIQTQIALTAGQDKATNVINQIKSVIELNPNGLLAQYLLYLSKQQAIGNINSVNEIAVQVAAHVANGNNENIGQIIKQTASSHTQQVIISSLQSQSSYPSSSLLSAPSSSSSSTTPSIQDALSFPRATQSNNIVNTRAVYDILFRTSTAGAIKTITINFPPGFYLGSAVLLENVGIGAGNIAVSGSTTTTTGQTLTYTVTNAANIPAFTIIRLEIANINNAVNPSSNYQVTITTRDPNGNMIDGPTTTTAFAIRQIGNGDIADGAITGNKISDGSINQNHISNSFMKRVILMDDFDGNSKGWNPDGFRGLFSIIEPNVSHSNSIDSKYL
jgi:hypothetical protein